MEPVGRGPSGSKTLVDRYHFDGKKREAVHMDTTLQLHGALGSGVPGPSCHMCCAWLDLELDNDKPPPTSIPVLYTSGADFITLGFLYVNRPK